MARKWAAGGQQDVLRTQSPVKVKHHCVQLQGQFKLGRKEEIKRPSC